MLNSGKKIRALRDKKNKYSNSRVVRNFFSERYKKTFLLLGKEGLNTVASTLNPFWKDILDNFSNLQNEKVIDENDVLSQSIWLNSHIKVNNISPCLKNWIERDIYIINDLLDQNKQIMSYEIFQDTYHVDTTFVEFQIKINK